MIGLKVEYVEKDGEMKVCDQCKEPIYGKRYNLELTVGNKITETDHNFCEACFQMNMPGLSEE